MKRVGFSSAAFVGSLILNGGASAQNAAVGNTHAAEVPVLSQAAARTLLLSIPGDLPAKAHVVRFTNDGFVVAQQAMKDGSPMTETTVHFASVGDLTIKNISYALNKKLPVLHVPLFQVSLYDGMWFGWMAKAPAVDFANAVYALKYYDAQERAIPTEPSPEFLEIASQYRALATKPPLPENIHRLQVQAAAAFQEKNYADAIDLYEQGVRQMPTWAAGHFNEALLLAETERYRPAMLHMNMYLALSPDAADAAAAKDKIYEWERKAAKAAPPPEG
jgi:hypothetical protein